MSTELEQNPGENTPKMWSIELGLYPGILFGIRTYKEEEYSIHVLYLPFIDIAFTIEH